MEKLTHVKSLTNILWNTDLLEQSSKNLTKMFLKNAEESPCNVICFSKSRYICRQIARKHICMMNNCNDIFDNLRYTELEYEEQKYKAFDFFIEIDCTNIDQKYLTDIIKQITLNNTITDSKHVILMYNLDYVSREYQNAFKKVLESSYKVAYFVITCESLHFIDDAIRSRCLHINCNNDISIILKQFIPLARPDISSDHFENLIQKSNNCCLNAAIMLEIKSPWELPDNLESFIQSNLLKLGETSSEKEYNELLKDFCYKYSASCISFNTFALTTINVLAKLKINDTILHQVTQLASEVDHDLILSNKILFAIEKFVNQIIDLMNHKKIRNKK